MFVDSVIQKTLNGVQGEASSKVDTDAAGVLSLLLHSDSL
jgi:hypothetical protein